MGNMKQLAEFIHYHHFKMETLVLVISSVKNNSDFVNIDTTSVYLVLCFYLMVTDSILHFCDREFCIKCIILRPQLPKFFSTLLSSIMSNTEGTSYYH